MDVYARIFPKRPYSLLCQRVCVLLLLFPPLRLKVLVNADAALPTDRFGAD